MAITVNNNTLTQAPKYGQQAFTGLSSSQATQQSPEVQALLARVRSGELTLSQAIQEAQAKQAAAAQAGGAFGGVNQLAEYQKTIDKNMADKVASAPNMNGAGPFGMAEYLRQSADQVKGDAAKTGQFGDNPEQRLQQLGGGFDSKLSGIDLASEIQKAAAIDPILGNQMAAEAVQKNPLFAGYFGDKNSLQADSLQKQSLLDSQYADATSKLGGLQDRASDAYKYIQGLQNQYQQDRQKLDPAQQLVDQRNQQLTDDRGLLSQDRTNLGSWNTALQGAMNNLRGLNEAGTAADSMFGYQASDYDALARAQDAIARGAASQENQLAASLAQRGLGAGPSGAAAQLFSGAQGNKFEQLAASQQQIAQQRIQNAMNLAQARSQAAQGGLGEANKTYGTTVNLLGQDTGAINAANQGMSNVVNLLGQGTNAINAGNQTYGQANQGINLGLQQQQNALNASQGNQGFLTSLGNLGLQAQGQQYNAQTGGTETGYNQAMGVTQAGLGQQSLDNQMALGQQGLTTAQQTAKDNANMALLGSGMNLAGSIIPAIAGKKATA